MTATCRPTLAGLLTASLLMLAACGQQSDADALAAAKANISKRNNAAAVVQLKGLQIGRASCRERVCLAV